MPKEAEPVLIAALKGTDPDLAAARREVPGEGVHPARRRAARVHLAPRGSRRDPRGARQGRQRLEPHRPRDRAHALPERPEDGEGLRRRVQQGPGERGHRRSSAAATATRSSRSRRRTSSTRRSPTGSSRRTAAAKGEAADALPPAALQRRDQADDEHVREGRRRRRRARSPARRSRRTCTRARRPCSTSASRTRRATSRVLDTPVPSTPPTAKMGHVKAAWMAAIYGNAQTKTRPRRRRSTRSRTARSASRWSRPSTTSRRRATLPTADKLEAIVEADKKAGVNYANDEVYKIALKLRSRVP